MHKQLSSTATTLAILLTAGTALAQEPTAPADGPADGEAGVSAGGYVSLADSSVGPRVTAGADANNSKTDAGEPKEKWIKRHRPVRHQMELGIYGGIMLPNTEHELYDPSINMGLDWQSYKKIAPDIGLRFGYYPLSFLGLEVEGGVVPTKLRDDSDKALLGTFRGYGLVQLPYRIAPFALVGFGMMGTNGSKIGNDIDPALHFGGGVKFYINRLLALRVDVRDNVTAQYKVDAGRTHHVEVLLGLSLLLNRKKPTPKLDVDTDGDGFLDRVDSCVQVKGVAPDGCPLATAEEPDTDGDGFKDSVDACVNEPGIAPDGCPDTDGDGFKDNVDKCPQVAGVAPDGCPPPDTDGDGIIDANDKCIQEPESKNNYKDADGCPDEVPKAVARFSGVIKGIYFDVDKDSIKKTSKKTLDEAIVVLKENDDVRLEISGHTDNTGDRDHNVDLSTRRAEAVKKYLVDAGIDASRLTARGAGPDEPVADNKTKAGKALNRRIEFKLLGAK
ncbi:MAG: OmpA family protein [Nannocystis sp.]|nr:OmpA family protein [Nannocystis sp.]